MSHISIPEGATWLLNRPIDVVFSAEVDFNTVSHNTINIASSSGVPATGSFTLQPDGRTVRFQPSCPLLADHSDAGLIKGGVSYILHVLGSESGGLTVRSTTGEPVLQARSQQFVTPISEESSALFIDMVPGPPLARIRGRAGIPSDEIVASYLEYGGDSGNRIYFNWDVLQAEGRLADEAYAVPLNLYSEPASRIALVLHLNQAVDPSAANLHQNLVAIEYLEQGGEWRSVRTRIELIENCSATGAALRLEPYGILPRGHDLRVILRRGFSDLVGQETLLDFPALSGMTCADTFDPGTSVPGSGADELFESFSLEGTHPAALQDLDSALETPAADWGGGTLSAGFDFAGTGGINGTFDWHIPDGVAFVLDTSWDTILGGPGGIALYSQPVVGGVVDIRNLYVPASSSIVIVGPNPAVFLCSGTVNVLGKITADGATNMGVNNINTTNIPELGAPGSASGGRGGTGSFLVAQNTPRGGHGYGAFQSTSGGGQGGESGFTAAGHNWRRAAGGGGGTFGQDYFYLWDEDTTATPVACQELIGFDAEPGGGGGTPPGRGSISQVERAQGGAAGPRPFPDGDPANDFFGTLLTDDGLLIRGELDRLWGGAGGGAGGDASNHDIFPSEVFSPTGDEKGAGGGGGGGALMISAIGEIIIHDGARISANGGNGGGGESSMPSVNRNGGGSGGGSGGHIVLSSATSIEIRTVLFPKLGGALYNDPEDGHQMRAISAMGGEGGAGKDNFGGSRANGLKRPFDCDSIPLERFLPLVSDLSNPPFNANCFNQLPSMEDELGPTLSVGGDGGPGIIQMHVADPAVNLRFTHADLFSGIEYYGGTGAQALDVTKVCAPPPLGWKGLDQAADVLLPFFGGKSTGLSKWIPLGLARLRSDGSEESIQFLFSGINPADGSVQRVADTQSFGAPLLPPTALGAPGEPPYLAADGSTLVIRASLIDDLYLRNPRLLQAYALSIEIEDQETELIVAAAASKAAEDELHLTFESAPSIAAIVGSDAAQHGSEHVLISLSARFLLVSTNGHPLLYPASSEIRISFASAAAAPDGQPDPAFTSEFTSDIDDLGEPIVGDKESRQPDFFRFRVEFNLDADGSGLTPLSPRPALEFFRIPLRF